MFRWHSLPHELTQKAHKIQQGQPWDQLQVQLPEQFAVLQPSQYKIIARRLEGKHEQSWLFLRRSCPRPDRPGRPDARRRSWSRSRFSSPRRMGCERHRCCASPWLIVTAQGRMLGKDAEGRKERDKAYLLRGLFSREWLWPHAVADAIGQLCICQSLVGARYHAAPVNVRQALPSRDKLPSIGSRKVARGEQSWGGDFTSTFTHCICHSFSPSISSHVNPACTTWILWSLESSAPRHMDSYLMPQCSDKINAWITSTRINQTPWKCWSESGDRWANGTGP